MNDQAISGLQCRAARVGKGLTQEDLAEEAKVSRGTIAALESDSREVLENNRQAVIDAFARLGVRFSADEETETVTFIRPSPMFATPSCNPNLHSDSMTAVL